MGLGVLAFTQTLSGGRGSGINSNPEMRLGVLAFTQTLSGVGGSGFLASTQTLNGGWGLWGFWFALKP